MIDQSNKKILDRLMRTCAWCTLLIPKEAEIFGFGARANQSLNLIDQEGKFVSITLSLTNKTTVAFVLPEDSPARGAGNYLYFIACSQECAKQLKDALEFELDVYDGLDPKIKGSNNSLPN